MKFLCLELQDSQTLLMIEKKASLAKTQQITDLERKLELTSTISSGLYINTYSTVTLNIKGTDRNKLFTNSTFPEMLFAALKKFAYLGFTERHQVLHSSSPLLALSINSNYYMN